MARTPFGGDLASYVVARKLVGDSLMLRLAPGARVAVYAQDGTTRLTDLRVGGQAVDALTADTDGQLPAWESPDGLIVSWLYLRTLDASGQPVGPLVKTVTTNPGQGGGGGVTYDDTALTQRVTALEDEPDPTWDSLAGKPAVIAAGTSATAARDAIGAGTSSLQLGTGSTTAKRGDWTPARADLDASTRDTLAKADAAVPATRKVAGKALSADVTIGAADLSATGTKDATTVLYGDNTWKTPPAADVRDKFLAADQSSTSATAWTQIPDLLITDAAGGQRWRVRAILYYYQAAASGIQLRLRTGNPGPTTADTRIIGRWGPALTTSATGQANYQQAEIIRWGDASRGTGYTTDASFVAGPNAGPNTSAVEFEMDVIFDAGAGTGRQIAFDFMQRVADANPTILLAESAVTFERIA